MARKRKSPGGQARAQKEKTRMTSFYPAGSIGVKDTGTAGPRARVFPFRPARHDDCSSDFPEYFEPVCGWCTYFRRTSCPRASWCELRKEGVSAWYGCEAWEGKF